MLTYPVFFVILPIIYAIVILKIRISFLNLFFLIALLFLFDYIAIFTSVILDAFAPYLILFLFMLKEHDFFYSLFISTSISNIANIIGLFINPWFFSLSFIRKYGPNLWVVVLVDHICLIIIFIVFRYLLGKYFNNKKAISISAYFSVVIFLYFFIVDIRLITFEHSIHEQNHFVMILMFTIIFSLFAFTIYKIYTQREVNREEKKILESNRNYLKEIHERYDHFKKLDHDYHNMMIVLNNFVENGDIQGTFEFAKDLLANTPSPYKSGIFKSQDLMNIYPIDLQQVFAVKVYEAKQMGIEVGIEVEKDIALRVENPLNSVRIMGILLDNAIEAAAHSIDKKIRIALIELTDMQIIVIMNTFPDAVDLVEIMSDLEYSSKGQGRGQGLAIVDKLLQDSNWEITTSIEEDWFIQELHRLTNEEGDG